MKKITFLLGAAMLFAGAANAQYRPLTVAAPAGVGAAPTQTAPTAANAAPAAVTRPAVGSTTFSNDSYVQQVGSFQEANVTQLGIGRNVADIDQTSSATRIEDRNYASQTQRSFSGSAATPADNQANIQQYGKAGTAFQTQYGSANLAHIEQGAAGTKNYASQLQAPNTRTGQANENKANIIQNTTGGAGGNSAVQLQLGNKENALAVQQGNSNVAVQTQGTSAELSQATITQSGKSNKASQNQSLGYNIAEATQSGNSNVSIQDQQGLSGATANRALVDQISSSNYGRQTQMGGSGNFVQTTQGSTGSGLSTIPSAGPSYSDTMQNGMNNSIIVKQNAQ